jgi:autotransporter-associated beta strand protein
MLLSWYSKLAATMARSPARRRAPGVPWRKRHVRPRLEPLEARLVLYDHIWSHGTCIFNCTQLWSDEQNWSNGSPAGDPDPAGAVVIFPQDAGSSWDGNFDDIHGELPVKSLYYHRGGFYTSFDLEDDTKSLLLSQDIYTDLAGTTTINLPIRFTSDADDFEHQIQVNANGELDLSYAGPHAGTYDLTGGISALVDKTGTGTLVLEGNDQNYAGAIALHQGTLQLDNENALASGTPITAVDAGTVLDLNNFDLTASFQTNVLGLIRLGSATLSFSGGSRTDIQGMISGSGALSVAGADAQVTLDARGTFDYTGATVVNAGTLRVDGTLRNSSVGVESGGTLEGAGTVPNVTFYPGSSFEVNSRGPNQYDELTATGTIAIPDSGTSLIINGGANLVEGHTFTILHSGAGIDGTFAGMPDGTVFRTDNKWFRINYTTTDVTLTLLPQFAPPAYYADGVGGGPHGLAQGDLNGDGTPDLVAVNGDSLMVFLGNGDGTFQSQPPITIPGSQPKTVTVGDFNGDGILDLAAAGGPSYSGTAYVLLGNGDGTFQAPVLYAVGAGPTDIEVADVNGDGISDLVVYNANDGVFNDWTGSISILYGNGDGTFQSATTPPPFPFHHYTTAAFAFLVDPDTGRMDLVVGNNRGFAGNDSVISVLVNQGNDAHGQAMFGEADYHTNSGINPTALAVADFNGDGLPDILWASGGRVGVFLWGAFDSPIFSDTGASGWSVAVGDFDGDGHLDVALPGGPGDSRLVVVYGHGDGTFGPPSTYTVNGGNDPF